jgi:xylulokinase
MDYITMRLTGRFTATQNTVLPMLVCDNRRLDRTEYDPWLVKTSTIDPAKLPELLPIDGIIGTLKPDVAAELGLPPETVVVRPANAQQHLGGGCQCDRRRGACCLMGNSGHLAFHQVQEIGHLPHSVAAIPSGKSTYLFW